MPVMSKATRKPFAGCSSSAWFVGGTLVATVGLDSSTTSFKGQLLNSGLALESKAGVVSCQTESAVNRFMASPAALLSLKVKGTTPSMYCSGALDTSTHWNFSAPTFSFRAVNEYWMTFGSMTRTYHLANLAVVLFMFFKVSVFLGSISAGARASRGARASARVSWAKMRQQK